MPGGFSPPPGPPRRGAETARSGGSTAAALGRGVLLPAVVAVAIATVFVAVFLAAFHDPVPHDLPIGIVGSERQAAELEHAANQRAPGTLAVSAVADVDAARRAVLHRDLFGVLVPDASPARLMLAGANGQGVTTTLTGALTPDVLASGDRLEVQDLRPLAPGDTRGLAIFYAAFGVVLGGFLFGITSYQAAPHLTLRWRVLSVLLFGLLSGLVIATVADVLYGSVPAAVGEVGALVTLLALAIASTAALILRLVGSAGTFVTSAGLLILGNATSTGNLPAEYLPGWMQPLSHVLPAGVAVRALRGATYFAGDGVATATGVLTAWTLLPLLLIGAVDALRRRRDTESTSHRDGATT